MAEPKNYNRMALQGWDVDDMEVVQQFGLDPSLAYTPEINDVMIEKMYNDNVQGYMKQGMTEQEARSKAGASRSKVRADVNALLKGK